VAADETAPVEHGLGQAGSAPGLFEPLLVGHRVHEVERVVGDDLGVQLLVLALVVEHREAQARADAEVVAAVRADVERLFQLSLVERRVALRALLEDALGLDATLLGGD